MIGTKLGSGTLNAGNFFMVQNWEPETQESTLSWNLFQVTEIWESEIVAIDHSDGRRNRFWIDEDAWELIHVLDPEDAEIIKNFARSHMLRQIGVLRDRTVEGVAV